MRVADRGSVDFGEFDPERFSLGILPDVRMLYASVGLSLNAKTTLVSQGQKPKAA